MIDNYIELLVTIQKHLAPHQWSCQVCGHPGRALKEDNSDWAPEHNAQCVVLELNEVIKNAQKIEKP